MTGQERGNRGSPETDIATEEAYQRLAAQSPSTTQRGTRVAPHAEGASGDR
jgi:hypothetical protein